MSLLKKIHDWLGTLLGRTSIALGALTRVVLANVYRLSNRRPFRLGYSQFKAQYLKAVLADENMLAVFSGSRPLPEGYGIRLDARTVEIPWALGRLRDAGSTEVLDAGSSLNYEFVVSSLPLADKHLVVTTLAPERRCYWKRGISYLYGDLRRLLIRSESMDVVCCISTIEHIGMDNERYAAQTESSRRGRSDEFLQVVDELKRVLRPGGLLLITFPFGQYEDHGWFQQFDSGLADRLIGRFGPTKSSEAVFKYDSRGWQISNRSEAAECAFFDVQASKYFKRGSTLDFPADSRAGEGAVMCLELRK